LLFSLNTENFIRFQADNRIKDTIFFLIPVIYNDGKFNVKCIVLLIIRNLLFRICPYKIQL